MGCCLPGSFVHEISQARILEWVVVSFSRGSSQPRDQANLCLLHWQEDSLPLSHPGSPLLSDNHTEFGPLLPIYWFFPAYCLYPLQLTEPLVPCEGLYTQVGWAWPYMIHATGLALVSETGPWLRSDPQRALLVSALWRVSLSPEGVFKVIGDIVWTPGSIQSWSQ